MINNFLTFAFGFGNVDWNYLYTEMKTHFVPALLKSECDFSFGSSYLKEEILMITILFNQIEHIKDFVFNGPFEKDNRIDFNVLDIYLTRII